MANIFGTAFETPEEAQQRIMQEQRQQFQAMGNDPNAQFGYALTNALSSIFGQNRDFKLAKQKEASLQQSQTAAEAIIKQREEESGKPLSDFEKRQIRSAHAADVISKLGGAENLAAASQIRATMIEERAAEQERLRQIEAHKANVSATQASTAVNERNVEQSLTIGELEHKLSLVEKMPDGEAKEATRAKYEGLLTEELKAQERQRGIDRRAEESLELQQETQEWRENQIPPKAQAQMINYQEEYFANSGQARQILTVANTVEQMGLQGGTLAQIDEALKKRLGTEDVASTLRAQAQSIIVKEAIQNLPPGVASDKDIELVMSGTLPNTANATQLASYLRGLAKLRALDAEYNRFASEYIAQNRNNEGLITAWQSEGMAAAHARVEKEYASASASGQQASAQPTTPDQRDPTAKRVSQDIIDSLGTTDD